MAASHGLLRIGAVGPKLYHSDIHQTVPRSTLADANQKRDWRIFADYTKVLIRQAAALFADEHANIHHSSVAVLKRKLRIEPVIALSQPTNRLLALVENLGKLRAVISTALK